MLGTAEPDRALVERALVRGELQSADELFDRLPRGQCRHFTVYEHGEPSEIFFVGYSID